MKTCNIPNCKEKHKAKGLCINHYFRFRYISNPEKQIEQAKRYYKQKVKTNPKRYKKTLEKNRTYDKKNRKELSTLRYIRYNTEEKYKDRIKKANKKSYNKNGRKK